MGQEPHLHPAVLETQSGVSGSVAHHRHMPICPIISVAKCREMSPCVVGHWGRYWGGRCFRGRSSPCAEYPITCALLVIPLHKRDEGCESRVGHRICHTD